MHNEPGFHGGRPLGLTLAQKTKAVRRALDAALVEVGSSAWTWEILNALKLATWRSQRDLARALGIEGPSLTRRIDCLERMGLVRRVADTTDRRVHRLELTETGEDAHERMLETVLDFNQRLSTGLSKEELGQLIALLDRLVANVTTDELGIPPEATAGTNQP